MEDEYDAKREFLDHVENRNIKCVFICIGSDHNSEAKREYCLPVGFTEEHYALFLESINFDYDNGFGSQQLFGNIWYEDGTWSERSDYDGSEWWEYKSCPPIPDLLQRTES